ncbi:MAG: carboxylesterase family protein [Rhizomicrobium sp.]
MRCWKYARRIAPLFVVALGVSTICRADDITRPVTTESGQVTGVVRGDVETFFGIPYAAPPVGDLRWKEPAPPKPWKGVRPAASFGPACRQTVDWIKEPQSEDCLFLNIWAPRTPAPKGKAYPVMVWFHGGGLFGGSGSQPGYDGAKLTRQGVILVTINYRLGVLGFFAHPELTAENPHQTSGNQGFLDQIAALKWVKQNIAGFGGDPGNVTIFGESAGSASVNMLVNSPLAEGLFQRAIGESSAIWSRVGLKTAEANGAKFGGALKAGSLKALRAMAADSLIKQPWQPDFTVDNYVYPANPATLLATVQKKAVPTLLGWNANEGVDLAAEEIGKSNPSLTEYQAAINRIIHPAAPAQLRNRYPANTQEQAKTSLYQLVTDSMGNDMWNWAKQQRTAAPTYVYFFVHWPAEPLVACNYGCKAGHGAEIRFVFDQLDQDARPWSADDRMMADRLVQYWTNFARTGNPNGDGVPTWPRFDGTPASVQRLGTDDEIKKRGEFVDFRQWE